MIFALFRTSVPVASPPFGMMLKTTLPSPSGGLMLGGSIPTWGSSGSSPVVGSMAMRCQMMRPESLSRDASILTSISLSGRRSTSVEYSVSPVGGVIALSPNEIAPQAEGVQVYRRRAKLIGNGDLLRRSRSRPHVLEVDRIFQGLFT